MQEDDQGGQEAEDLSKWRTVSPGKGGAGDEEDGKRDNQMPTNVGYFHFGTNHYKPVPELRAALTKIRKEYTDDRKEIAQSLIVLPEGFNIRKEYGDKKTIAYVESNVFGDLRQLANEFKITFVSALITRSDWASGQPRPYNSACLIGSSEEAKIICRKQGDDGSENYSACLTGHDIENPTSFSGFKVVVFICLDADHSVCGFNQKRHAAIKKQITDPTYAVLCVPASGNRHAGRSMVKGWGCKYVVYANSSSSGESFIGVDEAVKESTPKNTPENFIKLYPCA